MSFREHELFRELNPPAGGAERLSRRLDALGEPSRSRLKPAAVAAACAVVSLALWFAVVDQGSDEPRPDATLSLYQAREFDRLLGRAPERSDMTVSLLNESGTLSEIESSDPKIRIYEIN